MRLLERREVEPLLHPGTSGLPEAAAQRRVGEEALDRGGEARRIPRRDDMTRLAVDDDFRDSAHGRRDDREAGGHRLEDRHRKPLGRAGQDEDVGCGQQLGNVVALADELDHAGEAESSHLVFHGRAIRPVANDHGLEARLRQPGERSHERQRVLRRLEAADGDDPR
jgi:hypothetical protein